MPQYICEKCKAFVSLNARLEGVCRCGNVVRLQTAQRDATDREQAWLRIERMIGEGCRHGLA